jgi:hypothetical protein
MTYTTISGRLSELATRVITSSRLIALVMIVTFTSVAMQPAHAQSADTWKSIAIIGGATAAGAYLGHKVGGSTGAYVGAAVGASAGYAIDRRRRQNENYNSDYPYGGSGYYGDNGGYYGNDHPYSGNGGYYGDSRNAYPYPPGYQSNSHYVSDQRQVPHRR